ncbi:IBR domain containing protein [Trichomonas vaginalis G3]|uniref:RBR-type E3 ubiquitin transferase n=1 Tax=Trichomonas vaginalis (strain ATCC PRA-98 / G3) TaxID=412133 RepID=A2E3Y3_TRIV3|nr:ubiquitin conjugating enzyme binding [Trichomonas vaginalis G3]EAY12638.1 IBR domain containing protein [Trichomonas vaginalis G3]KAI5546999.1 ubiquitin conjugating enzyme binding [Trichomonas vaginalis G3]|eukprot:XP_001324861.1 IBR domain containing protein [Trichomonas vaginalis G3]
MNDKQYEYEVDLAARVRGLLDTKPDIAEWIQNCTEQLAETGEIDKEQYDFLIEYLLKFDLDLRQEIISVQKYDENGEQLMALIFESENQVEVLEEEDEDDDSMDIDFTSSKKEEVYVLPPCLDIDYFIKEQDFKVKKVAETLVVNEDFAYFILKYSDWDVTKAINNYLANPDSTLSKISAKSSQVKENLGLRLCGRGDCVNCCEEDVELYSLHCGHQFCLECWKMHISNQVDRGNTNIICMECNCSAPITRRDVKNLMGEDVYESYTNFLIESQISENPNLKHCINPRCQKILTSNAIGYCLVAECECGARMCWRCGEIAHDPITCENKEKWLNIANADKITAEWVHQNTKLCPKCHARIEKNGGCNHMTCYSCHYEFCWICGHEWASHGGDFYNCNRYKPEKNQGKNEHITDNVDRLAHYFERFSNHIKSRETEEKMRGEYQTRLLKLLTTHAQYPIEEREALKLLKKLFHQIDFARTILTWSYPHAYYMKYGSPELSVFEYVQRDVEKFVDQLTDMVENQTGLCANDFRVPMLAVEKNVETLLKHVSHSYSN